MLKDGKGNVKGKDYLLYYRLHDQFIAKLLFSNVDKDIRYKFYQMSHWKLDYLYTPFNYNDFNKRILHR